MTQPRIILEMKVRGPRLTDPLSRAMRSLEGLSTGDAFGETFFGSRQTVSGRLETLRILPGPWPWTDDTAMAICLVEELATGDGALDQDRFARLLAFHHERDPMRGYGAGAHKLLASIARGVSWRQAARAMFGGTGSWGNGAAMRVAPLGAYFADDLDVVVEQAARSAEVTHAHPEGIAGAVAVALAAADMWRTREDVWDRDTFFARVLARTPPSRVADGVAAAAELNVEAPVEAAAARLGNGSAVSAPDTVPFVLWCVSHSPDDYEASLWLTAAGLGDVDTTCAMVGGIVALRTGIEGIPVEWRRRREPLRRMRARQPGPTGWRGFGAPARHSKDGTLI